MAGTRQGGVKAAETNKKIHGEDFYHKIGTLGGLKSRGGGFAADRNRAREAGRKGGLASRRTAVKQVEAETKHQDKLKESWRERVGL